MTKKPFRAGAIAAALLMAGAQPCLAADLIDERDVAGRPAAFAGASIRLDLSKPKARPDARLQLGIMRTQGTMAAPPARLRGFELGRSRDGKAAFYVGGMETREARQKLGMGGSPGTYVLVGVGVLALVVLVAVASAPADLLDTCDDGPECL